MRLLVHELVYVGAEIQGERRYDEANDQTTSRDYVARIGAVRSNDAFRADHHEVEMLMILRCPVGDSRDGMNSKC